MKGVIVQVGEPKSIVLFNNGKIKAIPTPADCRVGMVVAIKLNNKLKIMAVALAAVFLVALGVFIGKTLNEGKTPAILAPQIAPQIAPQPAPPRAMPGPRMMGKRGMQVQTVTVEEAKNLPEDTMVLMTGNIAPSEGGGKHIFRDATGEIAVDIDRKIWRDLSITEADAVDISGEVEIERGEVEIDVKTVRKR